MMTTIHKPSDFQEGDVVELNGVNGIYGKKAEVFAVYENGIRVVVNITVATVEIFTIKEHALNRVKLLSREVIGV